MSIGIEIRNPPKEAFERIRVSMGQAMPRAMLKAAEVTAGEVRASVQRRLKQFTGMLGRSYKATLLKSLRRNQLRSGAISDLIYARIQDEGDTVYPRKAKALAIPLTTKAQRHARAGAGARTFPKKLVMIWPRGHASGILAELFSSGKRKGKIKEVHYALKKSSTIPGSHYLDDAKKNAIPQVEAVLDEAITKAGKAGGKTGR